MPTNKSDKNKVDLIEDDDAVEIVEDDAVEILDADDDITAETDAEDAEDDDLYVEDDEDELEDSRPNAENLTAQDYGKYHEAKKGSKKRQKMDKAILEVYRPVLKVMKLLEDEDALDDVDFEEAQTLISKAFSAENATYFAHDARDEFARNIAEYKSYQGALQDTMERSLGAFERVQDELANMEGSDNFADAVAYYGNMVVERTFENVKGGVDALRKNKGAAAAGAVAGGAAGSIVPVVGTAIGALVGAVGGAMGWKKVKEARDKNARIAKEQERKLQDLLDKGNELIRTLEKIEREIPSETRRVDTLLRACRIAFEEYKLYIDAGIELQRRLEEDIEPRIKALIESDPDNGLFLAAHENFEMFLANLTSNVSSLATDRISRLGEIANISSNKRSLVTIHASVNQTLTSKRSTWSALEMSADNAKFISMSSRILQAAQSQTGDVQQQIQIVSQNARTMMKNMIKGDLAESQRMIDLARENMQNLRKQIEDEKEQKKLVRQNQVKLLEQNEKLMGEMNSDRLLEAGVKKTTAKLEGRKASAAKTLVDDEDDLDETTVEEFNDSARNRKKPSAEKKPATRPAPRRDNTDDLDGPL